MDKGYVVSFKESKNPLQDILIPLEKRIGYVDGDTSVLPVYFYRVLGIYEGDLNNQNQYYNDLYELDEKLRSSNLNYLRIEQSISMPQFDESSSTQHLLGQSVPNHPTELKKHMMKLFHQSQLFYGSPIYSLLQQAFDQLFTLYLDSESVINGSRAENFAMKIFIWLKRYYSSLFQEGSMKEIPKVLFYGEAKLHEVYFLHLLAFLGVDILYIHTDSTKEEHFLTIDPNGQFSKRFLFPQNAPIQPFPQSDKRVRRATVAYQAKQEIDDIIYGEDVGIFKVRQFESGTTKPITLKTTYDEMKILWNEEAKIRPEFEVKNHVVHVPNLFVKVNGTHKDLDEYWKEIHELKKAKNTVFIKGIDFTPASYTRQEMYSTTFLFTDEGVLDKEALLKHKVYQLGYLNNSIQEFIINKINELIQSDMILREMTIDLKVKILMTIITMEPKFMRLIETFDYTGKIPKIIIYNKERGNFSELDAILLSFFNLVGADIVIYNPTNYSNIENWINPNYFDTYQLPSVQFDMEFPEKVKKEKQSFFEKLLSLFK